VQERNQAAITRLLNATRANQSIFLDNKFLKRKVRDAKTQRSQMWYVDLDTWYKGTTGGQDEDEETADGKKRGSEPSVEIPSMSVPADEHQTECAVSGEKFEKYWDDALQEWRYLDACKVTGPVAKKYVSHERSITCNEQT
jgi:pre-mRNA cleavage complex 2 protein Pcf11